MYLDAGTQQFSDVDVQIRGGSGDSGSFYEGRVFDWGSIERSISIPSSVLQTGNATLRLTDTDQSIRRFMAPKTSLRRLCEILIGDTATPHSQFQTLYIGEIVPDGTKFGPGYAQVELRDIHSRWLDHYIPPLITRTEQLGSGEPAQSMQEFPGSGAGIALFPNMPLGVDVVFAPIIIGIVASSADNMQGVIPIHLIDTQKNRYCVARHAVESVVVYRKLPGEEVFSIVDGPPNANVVSVSAEEYIVVEERITVENIPITFTWIDFLIAQPEGTEVRIDCHGINFRGNFGNLPVVSGQGALQNPVDARINLIHYATLKDPVAARYDITTWDTVHAQCAALGYTCDGAFTESITWRAAFSQLGASDGIDLFCNKQAELSLALTTSSDPTRPVFTDHTHILKETAFEGLAAPSYNRIRYKFAKNYATGQWGKEDLYNNDTDLAAIGEVQETPLEMLFVRNAAVAAAVAQDRARWYDLDCFPFECEMPAPEVFADLELAKLIGITHFEGLTTSTQGWTNEEFKLMSLRFDLGSCKVHAKMKKHVGATAGVAVDSSGQIVTNGGRPATAEEWEDPTQVNPARSRIIDGNLAIDADAALGASLTYAECQITSTNGVTPNYAQLHLYDFPEPSGAVNSVTLHIVCEFLTNGNTIGHAVDCWVLNGRTTAFPAPPPPEFVTSFPIPSTTSDFPKAEYTVTFTAAEFQTFFSSLGANVHVRFTQWSSLLNLYSPDVLFRVYDAWIEYN